MKLEFFFLFTFSFTFCYHFCFAQKIKYGQFSFERTDSIFCEGNNPEGVFDTVLFEEDGKIAVRVLGSKPVRYLKSRDTVTYSFNKKLLSQTHFHDGSESYRFYDFKNDVIDFIFGKNGNLRRRKVGLKKSFKYQEKQIFVFEKHRNVRRGIFGFDCFKVVMNKIIKGEIVETTELFVTDQIKAPGNQMLFIKGLPPLCPLFLERKNKKGSHTIRLIDFQKKKKNLKKERKQLISISEEFSFD